MARFTYPRRIAALALALVLILAGLTGCPDYGNPRAPEANFTTSVQKGLVPLTVEFHDASQPGTSPIRVWLWDFGDGGISRSPNPVHTYSQPGTYTVSLTVETAEGHDTRTRKNMITVNARSDFAFIGPDGGSVAIGGAQLTVPPNALEQETSVGIIFEEDAFSSIFPEDTQVISRAFTIAHASPLTHFFAVDDDTGAPVPAIIETPIDYDAVPEADRNSDHIHLVARLEGGVRIPIFGSVEDKHLRVPVTGLPPRATYGVVYRPDVERVAVQVADRKDAVEADWGRDWSLYLSPLLLEQLTAVRLGSIESPSAYEATSFTPLEMSRTRTYIAASIGRFAPNYEARGLRSPALVQDEDGAYPVVFYNFVSLYNKDFADFRDLVAQTAIFGQVAIDPAQLVNVSIHNAERAQDNPDLSQEYDFDMAFAQALYDAALASYALPPVTADNAPADEKDVPYFSALRQGGGAYLGQRAAGLFTARSFGPHEIATVTDPLFTAFTPATAGYAAATQDFLFFLDNNFEVDLLDMLFADDAAAPGLLERVRESSAGFQTFQDFEDATDNMREAIHETLEDYFGLALGELYWQFARERAVEQRGPVLRASDNLRDSFLLQEDLFRQDAIVETRFVADATDLVVQANQYPALAGIPPFSSRAVVVDVDPGTENLSFTFNASEWHTDKFGNSMAVKAYPEGRDGVELAPGDETLVLNEVPAPCPFARDDPAVFVPAFFPVLDEDDSGGLQLEEVQTLVPDLSSAEFDAADGDGDGELSRDEMLDLANSIDLRVLGTYDANRNGYLEEEELAPFIGEDKFRELDTNGNNAFDCGDVDTEEQGAKQDDNDAADSAGRVVVLLSNLNFEAANSIYMRAQRPAASEFDF
ncbi:MAG: PKD domain-containing protein [Candidatus Hydrogenedentota bacterium]